jgi:hypothetical protein
MAMDGRRRAAVEGWLRLEDQLQAEVLREQTMDPLNCRS